MSCQRDRIASGCVSHSRVLPSMSVNRKVTSRRGRPQRLVGSVGRVGRGGNTMNFDRNECEALRKTYILRCKAPSRNLRGGFHLLRPVSRSAAIPRGRRDRRRRAAARRAPGRSAGTTARRDRRRSRRSRAPRRGGTPAGTRRPGRPRGRRRRRARGSACRRRRGRAPTRRRGPCRRRGAVSSVRAPRAKRATSKRASCALHVGAPEAVAVQFVAGAAVGRLEQDRERLAAGPARKVVRRPDEARLVGERRAAGSRRLAREIGGERLASSCWPAT